MESNRFRFKSFAIGMAVVAGTIGLGDGPVLASQALEPAPAEVETHCVIEVTGLDRDGVFITGPEICFATEAEVDTAAGSSRSSNGTIGRHYTSTGYAGSSLTISGTTCGGGVWYPTGSWNNNIESSRHYCGSSKTRFYDSSNCSSGEYAISTDTVSLGWANNKPSCVRYG